ncbi:MAG: hypothetical protein ACYDG2_17695, partial [Ruminiclostridium sp.]
VLSYAMLPQVAEKFFKQRIEDRQKSSISVENAQKAPVFDGISPEVVAAISAAIVEMGKRDGKQYSIANISRLGNQQNQQNQNRWSLYGMLDRFRAKI